MKTANFILLIVLILGGSSAYGKDECSVKEAEAFLEKNDTAHAGQCVDAILGQNPSNVDAQFLKGKICIKENNFECADKQFEIKAVAKKHGLEISELYKEKAEYYIGKSDIDNARRMFWKASFFDKNKRKDACKRFYSLGDASKDKAQMLYYSAAHDFCKQQF